MRPPLGATVVGYRIVPRPDFVNGAASGQTRASRDANRRRGIRIAETRSSSRQLVYVRRLDIGVASTPHHAKLMFIGQDEQHVRSLHQDHLVRCGEGHRPTRTGWFLRAIRASYVFLNFHNSMVIYRGPACVSAPASSKHRCISSMTGLNRFRRLVNNT